MNSVKTILNHIFHSVIFIDFTLVFENNLLLVLNVNYLYRTNVVKIMFTERIMITFELNEDDKSVQWNETLHVQLYN